MIKIEAAPLTIPDPTLKYRDRFPILATTNYLISNSLGAVPTSAKAALVAYYETWATRGVRAWEEGWWTLAAELGNLVAPLIGAGPDEVVFGPSVTQVHAQLFSCFDYANQRTRIVTDAMHFPSVLYLIAEQAKLGAEVVVVPTEDGISVDTDRIIEAIDERTAFVNISHVLFKSAYVHDVAAISAKARQVGAISIIDGYQSVGVIPVEVAGIDAYIGGCLKWLCGGPGNAFAWVNPESRTRLVPRMTGWMAHQRPFRFEPTLDRRDDSWRYLVGTPNISGLYAARPGLEIINEIGVAAIREKSLRQTSLIHAEADRRGFRCTTPSDLNKRGGTVALDLANGYEVSKALKSREILCDFRVGAGVRLSPHFYSKDEELIAAMDMIDEIIKTSEWKHFAHQSPSMVT